ncbi:6-bladed beta-propeller [Penaeicola halotolerans]|uniref:6-bladed beta-propeller n=1 Tax=Penaeicola halotolerans TaxID=2793196 RepID=UPI001CF8A219|nr:6-bladed beta-propeller [Penaeicola halotolerans]
MRRTIFYAVTSVVLSPILFSCGGDGEQGNKGLTTIEVTDELYAADELYDEVEFIPLQNTIEAQMKVFGLDPFMVSIKDAVFIVTDGYKDPKVHKYSLKGEFISNFGKRGGGPGEYESIDYLESDGKHLIIISQGNLLYYDASTLDYVKTEKLSADMAWNFTKLEDEKWFTASFSDIEVTDGRYFRPYTIEDIASGKIDTLPIKVPLLVEEMESSGFVFSQDKLWINIPLSDTIYTYEEGSMRPIIYLNLADRNLPNSEKFISGENDVMSLLREQKYAFNIGPMTKADDVLKLKVFGVKRNPEGVNMQDETTIPINDLFINIKSGQAKLAKSAASFSDSGFTKDGYFYQLLFVERWLSHLESGFFGKHTEKLQEAVDNLTDGEDPILVKYKIKF